LVAPIIIMSGLSGWRSTKRRDLAQVNQEPFALSSC
jgi:hypothetical protein